jgi:hypothetical protein
MPSWLQIQRLHQDAAFSLQLSFFFLCSPCSILEISQPVHWTPWRKGRHFIYSSRRFKQKYVLNRASVETALCEHLMGMSSVCWHVAAPKLFYKGWAVFNLGHSYPPPRWYAETSTEPLQLWTSSPNYTALQHRPVAFSYFVRVPPDVISLQHCTPVVCI